MKKDVLLEEKFREYFDGAAAPKCDLTEAKRALQTEKGGRRGKKRIAAAIASVAACLLLAVVILYNLMPFTAVYSLSEAAAETLSYTEVKERYNDQAGSLTSFSLADNATADYTLYTAKEQEVLLRVDIALVSGRYQLKGTVWINLSEGKFVTYVAEELKDYASLSSGSKDSYLYEREYINGEYVSKAYYVSDLTTYYVDVTSPSSSALTYVMELIM